MLFTLGFTFLKSTFKQIILPAIAMRSEFRRGRSWRSWSSSAASSVSWSVPAIPGRLLRFSPTFSSFLDLCAALWPIWSGTGFFLMAMWLTGNDDWGTRRSCLQEHWYNDVRWQNRPLIKMWRWETKDQIWKQICFEIELWLDSPWNDLWLCRLICVGEDPGSLGSGT